VVSFLFILCANFLVTPVDLRIMNMFWEAVATVAHPADFEAVQRVVTPICDVYMHFLSGHRLPAKGYPNPIAVISPEIIKDKQDRVFISFLRPYRAGNPAGRYGTQSMEISVLAFRTTMVLNAKACTQISPFDTTAMACPCFNTRSFPSGQVTQTTPCRHSI
jgi:hypothetical protein